jgi:hypothetical protein
MSSFESLVEEIRILEDHFANCFANDASDIELAIIFNQIKLLKNKLNITCHSQLTVPPKTDMNDSA